MEKSSDSLPEAQRLVIDLLRERWEHILEAWRQCPCPQGPATQPPCEAVLEELAHLFCREEGRRSREREATVELLESLLAKAPIGFAMVDRELRYVRLNAPMAAMNGVPLASHFGRQVREVIPGMVRSMEPPLRRVLETAESLMGIEVSGETPAHPGATQHWLSSYYPVRDATGQVMGVGTMMGDITERKQAADTQRILLEAGRLLAESLDYEGTLRNVAQLLVSRLADYCTIDLLDEAGSLRCVGGAAADPARQQLITRAMAYSPSTHPGSPMAEVLASQRPHLVPEVDRRWLRRVASSAEHLHLLEALAPVSMAILPLVARGRTLGLLILSSTRPRVFGSQLTELVLQLADRAALAIDNARLFQQAREAARIREDVLAIVSHDLRNPLGAIQMSASMLLRELPADAPGARMRRHVETVQRASARMRRLISDLLDFGGLAAGSFSLEQGVHEVRGLLEEALEMMGPQALEKGVELELNEEEAAHVRVACDRERILQVFANLLGNAIKFTPEGGRVRFGGTRAGEEVRFEVRDTGPGIHPEELPFIFNRYWRGERKRTPGTGLGLFITKGIVELHGGHVWAESVPGQGATFYFTLRQGEG